MPVIPGTQISTASPACVINSLTWRNNIINAEAATTALKHPPANAGDAEERGFHPLGWEDPLEKKTTQPTPVFSFLNSLLTCFYEVLGLCRRRGSSPSLGGGAALELWRVGVSAAALLVADRGHQVHGLQQPWLPAPGHMLNSCGARALLLQGR